MPREKSGDGRRGALPKGTIIATWAPVEDPCEFWLCHVDGDQRCACPRSPLPRSSPPLLLPLLSISPSSCFFYVKKPVFAAAGTFR